MSIQLIGGAAICVLGLITVVFAVLGQLRKGRTRRKRSLNDTAANIQRCWQIVERVPVAYLPASLKRLVARIVQSSSSRALKLDPKNSYLLEQEARSRLLLASAAREQPPRVRPLLTPKERKLVAESLRDLKRMTTHAKQTGVLEAPECNREIQVIDTVLLRIMVDHLKQNAANSETVGHTADAVAYLMKAVQTLSGANDGGRFKDEIQTLNRDATRLRETLVADTERKRSADDKALLKRLHNDPVDQRIARR